MLRQRGTRVLLKTKNSVMVITGTPLLNAEKRRILVEKGIGKK